MPQRGHVIVLPDGATRRPAVGTAELGDAFGPASGALPSAPGGVIPFGGASGVGVANGPPGGMPGGGAIIGAPTPGGPAGGANAGAPGGEPGGANAGAPGGGGANAGAPGGEPGGANAGAPGVVPASAAPQLRQNFIPGGFSPRQVVQITGNPAPAPGVCAGAAANAVPQFKQNDDPGGLWWPQAEQRSITPLLTRVSRKANAWEMGQGRFATWVASC